MLLSALCIGGEVVEVRSSKKLKETRTVLLIHVVPAAFHDRFSIFLLISTLRYRYGTIPNGKDRWKVTHLPS